MNKMKSRPIITHLICFRCEDWNYLCNKINWSASWLDAKAIQIMNEPIHRKEKQEQSSEVRRVSEGIFLAHEGVL